MIDAHVHLWDLTARPHPWLEELPALRRSFGPSELEAASAGVDRSGAVLVQVLHSEDETREFLALARADPRLVGVVGYVDLRAADLDDRLDAFCAGPGGDHLVGLRHLAHLEADPGFLARAEVVEGLRTVARHGLTFDLICGPAQLPAALVAAEAVGGLRFVLDHGGLPPIASGDLAPWRALVTGLARLEHVSCKVSGLFTQAGTATGSAIRPVVEHLLECFGPNRLLLGSDWPLCELVAPYARVVTSTVELLRALLSADELDLVLSGTATAVYRLTPRLNPQS